MQYKVHLLHGVLKEWKNHITKYAHHFSRSTRHGGGQIKSNALKELLNGFYRRQLQRYLTKQHENGEPTNRDCIVEENIDTQPKNEGDIGQEYMDAKPINEDSP